METIPFEKVLSTLRSRLNARLRRASIYPELLAACQPLASRIKTLETLQRKISTLHLLNPEGLWDARIHAINDHYKYCKGRGMWFRVLGDNVFALTYIQ